MISLLGLIGSPVFRYVAVALALLAAVAWIRYDAAEEARLIAEAECQATFEKRVDEETKRQREISETVLEKARRRVEESETQANDLREQADVLLRELESMGSNPNCILDDATRDRLRKIN